ncbi:SRPBCC family protein [Rhodohalobacter mucosus]|uniref:Activator of Hsp90 ATPase homologue 1/2-like C-terminal domain-containing protein n=1 Tax=Rhodohalobacter mucosus TaxID=2079485 RepID=A0A316TVN1_9BACT|nr:SRPBCC domain-containing protein [Rhodohalobacter mucosus]PWN07399.1 hypothetical protein DDZ15_03805 [Rhodohalobacter mucosus]
MSRQIKQTYRIQRSTEDVFDALLTPSQICTWWFAQTAIVIPEKNGLYAITWGEDIDNPDYISIATISELIRPERLVLSDFQYHSKEGDLPFDTDLQLEFSLSKENGGTVITVLQTGFPEDESADGFYNSCVQGWTETMTSFLSVLKEKKL